MATDDKARSMFEFSAGPYTNGEIAVVRFRGREEISRPYSFDITLASSAVDPARIHSDVLGGAARLTFGSSDGTSRRIHGILRSIQTEQIDTDRGRRYYSARLVPRLWLLRRKKTSRIFQDQTVVQIVTSVLKESGVENRFQLSHDRTPRDYCVQYKETDLAFITRLLAEEGIFYFFADPAEGGSEPAGEVVVFGDIAEHYVDVPGLSRMPYREGSNLTSTEADAVHSFSRGEEVRSGTLRVQHFDYRRPTTPIVSTATMQNAGEVKEQGKLGVFEYESEIEQDRIDPNIADQWLGQLRAKTERALGQSRSRRVVPGAKFTLDYHPNENNNREWAIIRVDHEGKEPGATHGEGRFEPYENHFVCLPSSVAARPKRPKKRLQQVMETATVVGPPGEEIHTDELGRIKVQFHWDLEGKNDEHSSCWLRAMQPWAGAAWGFQFLPRIGMEVVVSFVGGDTDRPMVLGSTYNGTTLPPFALPKNKTLSGIRTRSTPGGSGHNELSFEDAASKEKIYLHAARDLEEVVLHDHSRSVHENETVKVDGLRETTIGKDNARTVHQNETVKIDGSRETTIGKDNVRHVMGTETVTVEKSLVLHVVGQYVLRVDGGGGGGSSAAAGSAAQTAMATADPGAAAAASAALAQKAADDRAEQLANAKLNWHVASLPDDLRSQGDGLESSTLGASNAVSALGLPVQSLDRRSGQTWDSVVTALQAGDKIPTDQISALTANADEIKASVEQAKQAVADALAKAQSGDDERLGKAQAAAKDRLAMASAQIDKLEARVASAHAQVERSEILAKATQRPDYPGKPGGSTFFGGSGSGGGGMPDDAKSPVAGTTLDITGGGLIKGDKFKIEAGGCSINMEGGTLTINGKVVAITGTPITLN